MGGVAMRVSSGTFVGRRRELERATAMLARAREGQTGVLLISGEAGVGKTRLTREIAGRARELGFRQLWGRSMQVGGEGLPVGAVIDAPRPLQGDLPPMELQGPVRLGRRGFNP